MHIFDQVALYIFSRNQSNSESAIEQTDKNRQIIKPSSSSHRRNWHLHIIIIIKCHRCDHQDCDLCQDHHDHISRKGIVERFRQTDRALEEVPTWPDVSFSCFVMMRILMAMLNLGGLKKNQLLKFNGVLSNPIPLF